MPLSLPMPGAFTLLVFTALGYALATIGMKMASAGGNALALILIAVGLLIAVLAEIGLLKGGDLPVVYLMIVVAETILVLGYAAFIGERMTLQQVTGAVLVLGGFALVSVRF